MGEEDYTSCRWVEVQYPTSDVAEETKGGSSPYLLSFGIEGPTWGCDGFQDLRIGAAAGLGGVGAGAKSRCGGERFFGRTVRFLHLLRA